MFCQVCGAHNPDDDEYCGRCDQKLLVLSGATSAADQEAFESRPEEQLSFDEHLLERISILEEVVKRTAETLRHVLATLHSFERKLVVGQTGLTSLQQLLDSKEVVDQAEWNERWESHLEEQLLALELRERFAASRETMAGLYRGEDREAFLRRLDGAEKALASFEVEGALALLGRAFSEDRDNHELAFFLGEACFNVGDSEGALLCFEQVLSNKPWHYESLVYTGVLLHEQGQGERAETLLLEAVERYPDAFLPAFSLGAVYLGRGEPEKACTYLERAVGLDPLPQAQHLLGSAYYELGRLGPAIRRLEAAVASEPGAEEARYLLGLAYLDRRWYRKAQDTLREALAVASEHLRYDELLPFLAASGPGLPPLERRVAESLERAEQALAEGDVNDGMGRFRRLFAEEPEQPVVLLSYAMACLETGRVQEMRPVIDRLLNLEGEPSLQAAAYAMLLEALRAEGRYRESNRVGRLLLSGSGSDLTKTLAYSALASNQVDMGGDLDTALSYARRSLELAPPDARRLPLAVLGWVHYQRREFEQAVDCLARSSELGPSAHTLTRLGVALLASGQRERARSVLERARRLREKRTTVDGKLIECLREGPRLNTGLYTKSKK